MFRRLLTATIISVAAGGAVAATATSTLTVGATLLNVCVIGPGVMAFGGVSLVTNVLGVTSTPASETTADVPVLCTAGTSATLEGDTGQNSASGARRMKNVLSTALLPYSIFKDPGRTTDFGTGSGGIGYTGTGLPGTITLYGRITGSSINGSTPGLYADSVALTLTYSP